MGNREIAQVMPFNTTTACFTCSSPSLSTSHLSVFCFHSISAFGLPLKTEWQSNVSSPKGTGDLQHLCECFVCEFGCLFWWKHRSPHAAEACWRAACFLLVNTPTIWRTPLSAGLAKRIELPLFPTAKARQNTVRGALFFRCVCGNY